MLFPAVTWLFIQFSMSGIVLGTSANAMQIEICSPFGAQTITIDPETGEPTEQAIANGCDWCQSFSIAVDTASRSDVVWSNFERNYAQLLPVLAPVMGPIRLAAGFQSRAPPSIL